MENSDNNVKIWGIKSENNFGLNSDFSENNRFPEIRFVKYNEESKTANIIIELNDKKYKYEVLWNKETGDNNDIGEPETKISDKTGRIFLIIPNKNSKNGNSLLCKINGEIKIIDEIYEEGDFLVSKELDLYNVSFQKPEEVIKKVGDSITDVLIGKI